MLAFGSYMPGSSVIHQANAQVKIILACAFSVCALAAGSWIALGALALAVFVCFALARVDVRSALAGLVPLAVLLGFTVLAHTVSPASVGCSAAATQPGSLGFEQCVVLGDAVALTLDGFIVGLFFAARIALVIIACSLLTSTTTQLAIVQGLQSLLRPLRAVKLPVDDICTIISIALRFVPLITTQLQQIKRAREARGVLFAGGGAVASIKAWCGVLTPLFVSLFRQADVLARAMDARCYGFAPRVSLYESRFGVKDLAACAVGVAGMVLIVVLL